MRACILVRPVIPWPRHGGEHVTENTTVYQLPRPELLLELDAPVEPTLNWECGTDVIWPVLAIHGPEGGGRSKPKLSLYVGTRFLPVTNHELTDRGQVPR